MYEDQQTRPVLRGLQHQHHASGRSVASVGNDKRLEITDRTTEGLLAALAATPVDLKRLIDGKSRERLAEPAADGGWGMVEIIPHFWDWELVTHDRVWAMLDADKPIIEDVDDSLWAIEHDYSSLDPIHTLEEFRDLREALVQRLETLGDADWERTALFGKQGTITLRWLMNKLCDHDAKHLLQARDVLA